MSLKGKILGVMVGAFLSTVGLAHEGHDHAPSAAQAPHGGVVKQGKDHAFELVSNSSGIKVFPLSRDLKPVSLSDISISATSQIPKKKKEAVKFTKGNDHFAAKVNAKGAYRYTLELNVSYKDAKTNKVKKESVTFQVEPQS